MSDHYSHYSLILDNKPITSWNLSNKKICGKFGPGDVAVRIGIVYIRKIYLC